VLNTFVLAGAQRPLPEEAPGTSEGPREMLKAGLGYKNIIDIDLVDDPKLTAENIRGFKKAYKELYDFTMVSPEYLSAGMLCRIVLTRSPLFMQDVITDSQKKSEKLREVVSDHQEFAALERCVNDERTKNLHLEKANSELQQQLEEQKKALEAQKNTHREQLQEQKKAHQGKPLLASSTYTYQVVLDSEKALHRRT
jgi:hypothetical protein